MTHSIWETIASTPWWIVVLFIFLIRIGFLATKPHAISIKQLLFLPALFLILSLSIMFYMQFKTINFMLWAGAILSGIPLGWLHFRLLNVQAMKDKARLYIPGSWALLIIILLMIPVRYYYGHDITLDTRMFFNPSITAGLAVLYGLFTGLFIGRITYALRCLKIGPYYST